MIGRLLFNSLIFSILSAVAVAIAFENTLVRRSGSNTTLIIICLVCFIVPLLISNLWIERSERFQRKNYGTYGLNGLFHVILSLLMLFFYGVYNNGLPPIRVVPPLLISAIIVIFIGAAISAVMAIFHKRTTSENPNNASSDDILDS